MTTLLDAIPGNIPGILQEYSALILQDGVKSVALSVNETHVEVVSRPGNCWGGAELGLLRREEVSIDLTKESTRWQVAIWAERLRKQYPHIPVSYGEQALLMTVVLGDELTPEQIDTLARLVLRLAGRST